MSVELAAEVDAYMARRRARGYKLIDEGVLLARFVAGLAARGLDRVSVADAVAYATGGRPVSRATQARRLAVIRRFVDWLRIAYPEAGEPIPPDLIRGSYQRRTPYLYSADQAEDLVAGAAGLSSPAIAEAMRILIGLLWVSGLRSGEALALNIEDIDWDRAVLTVRGKLDRHRLVPLHASTAEQLRRHCQHRTSGPLLLGVSGHRISASTVHQAFRRILAACPPPEQPGARPPRLHDFRHTLAVDTLTDAHRQGLDVDARLAVLSTFLGHVDAEATYWYLTASPELLGAVTASVAAALHRRQR